ncbi:hypothetical protein FRC08_018433 [Ceratobasidium sp. 394]|nr:hypothetical protein FRC08_018433 [Ceratobasidium sp. 394]
MYLLNPGDPPPYNPRAYGPLFGLRLVGEGLFTSLTNGDPPSYNPRAYGPLFGLRLAGEPGGVDVGGLSWICPTRPARRCLHHTRPRTTRVHRASLALAESLFRHHARGDVCQNPILGVRYKCIHPSCPDFDISERSQSLPLPTHSASLRSWS